ncbi:unnamed protein product [Cyprideis torosa]|uniref:Uncharacterized protein n=1 Tax=Cyprideis torosa TaxID=163714 RepID=A0A7R8WI06_9CRUS|nr:unnamed protein product [Cyprideis torosa]CAG0893597.1 unnamed protein product [Cyprideis torosa]
MFVRGVVSELRRSLRESKRMKQKEAWAARRRSPSPPFPPSALAPLQPSPPFPPSALSPLQPSPPFPPLRRKKGRKCERRRERRAGAEAVAGSNDLCDNQGLSSSGRPCQDLRQVDIMSEISLVPTGASTVIKKGVLLTQKDRILSRWRERYWMLTRDYLSCFKKNGKTPGFEMGPLLFKLNLVDLLLLEFVDKGDPVIAMHIKGEEKLYLKAAEYNTLQSWMEVLNEAVSAAKYRRESFISDQQFHRENFNHQILLQRLQQDKVHESPTHALNGPVRLSVADAVMTSQTERDAVTKRLITNKVDKKYHRYSLMPDLNLTRYLESWGGNNAPFLSSSEHPKGGIGAPSKPRQPAPLPSVGSHTAFPRDGASIGSADSGVGSIGNDSTPTTSSSNSSTNATSTSSPSYPYPTRKSSAPPLNGRSHLDSQHKNGGSHGQHQNGSSRSQHQNEGSHSQHQNGQHQNGSSQQNGASYSHHQNGGSQLQHLQNGNSHNSGCRGQQSNGASHSQHQNGCSHVQYQNGGSHGQDHGSRSHPAPIWLPNNRRGIYVDEGVEADDFGQAMGHKKPDLFSRHGVSCRGEVTSSENARYHSEHISSTVVTSSSGGTKTSSSSRFFVSQSTQI